MKKNNLLGLFICVAAGPIQAQNSGSLPDTNALEAVTITALRQPIAVSQSAEAVTILKVTDLNNVPTRSLPEYLMQTPMAFVQKTNMAAALPLFAD